MESIYGMQSMTRKSTMSLHFYLYQSPFVSEFIQAKGSMGSHREGILIEWKHSMGSAWAECAPLPGFSKESLADCINLLVTHKPEMEKQLDHLEDNAAQNQNSLPTFFDFEYAERVTLALYTSTQHRFPSRSVCLKYASLRLGKSKRKSATKLPN